jgi:hypothetical protein
MMLMAPNGHFLGQIPQPMHKLSEMKAILDSGVTSMQRRPLRTTGQDFLHSCLHFCIVHVQQISHILDPVRTDLRFALNYTDVLSACGVVQAGYGGVGLHIRTLSVLMMAILTKEDSQYLESEENMFLTLQNQTGFANTYRVSLSDMLDMWCSGSCKYVRGVSQSRAAGRSLHCDDAVGAVNAGLLFLS